MIFYRIHRLWEWEMKMEKELTHEKMHELGIEHAHTHTHSHQQTKAVLNRMSKIIGHMEAVKTMVENGRDTARRMYGCRGFMAHHNTDIWGDTAPQDLWIPGSFWVMGGAWLCTHIWTHYQYTGDTEFLRRMFPVMREAAQFFLDFCIEHEIDGVTYLCTCPSVSPENMFVLPNGEQGANSIGVTMDNQICGICLHSAIRQPGFWGWRMRLTDRLPMPAAG